MSQLFALENWGGEIQRRAHLGGRGGGAFAFVQPCYPEISLQVARSFRLQAVFSACVTPHRHSRYIPIRKSYRLVSRKCESVGAQLDLYSTFDKLAA